MLQRAVASDGVTRSMTATPSMTGTAQTLAGRGGTAAALAGSFREESRRRGCHIRAGRVAVVSRGLRIRRRPPMLRRSKPAS
jgi:hypothetical protein